MDSRTLLIKLLIKLLKDKVSNVKDDTSIGKDDTSIVETKEQAKILKEQAKILKEQAKILKEKILAFSNDSNSENETTPETNPTDPILTAVRTILESELQHGETFLTKITDAIEILETPPEKKPEPLDDNDWEDLPALSSQSRDEETKKHSSEEGSSPTPDPISKKTSEDQTTTRDSASNTTEEPLIIITALPEQKKIREIFDQKNEGDSNLGKLKQLLDENIFLKPFIQVELTNDVASVIFKTLEIFIKNLAFNPHIDKNHLKESLGLAPLSDTHQIKDFKSQFLKILRGESLQSEEKKSAELKSEKKLEAQEVVLPPKSNTETETESDLESDSKSLLAERLKGTVPIPIDFRFSTALYRHSAPSMLYRQFEFYSTDFLETQQKHFEYLSKISDCEIISATSVNEIFEKIQTRTALVRVQSENINQLYYLDKESKKITKVDLAEAELKTIDVQVKGKLSLANLYTIWKLLPESDNYPSFKNIKEIYEIDKDLSRSSFIFHTKENPNKKNRITYGGDLLTKISEFKSPVDEKFSKSNIPIDIVQIAFLYKNYVYKTFQQGGFSAPNSMISLQFQPSFIVSGVQPKIIIEEQPNGTYTISSEIFKDIMAAQDHHDSVQIGDTFRFYCKQTFNILKTSNGYGLEYDSAKSKTMMDPSAWEIIKQDRFKQFKEYKKLKNEDLRKLIYTEEFSRVILYIFLTAPKRLNDWLKKFPTKSDLRMIIEKLIENEKAPNLVSQKYLEKRYSTDILLKKCLNLLNQKTFLMIINELINARKLEFSKIVMETQEIVFPIDINKINNQIKERSQKLELKKEIQDLKLLKLKVNLVENLFNKIYGIALDLIQRNIPEVFLDTISELLEDTEQLIRNPIQSKAFIKKWVEEIDDYNEELKPLIYEIQYTLTVADEQVLKFYPLYAKFKENASHNKMFEKLLNKTKNKIDFKKPTQQMIDFLSVANEVYKIKEPQVFIKQLSTFPSVEDLLKIKTQIREKLKEENEEKNTINTIKEVHEYEEYHSTLITKKDKELLNTFLREEKHTIENEEIEKIKIQFLKNMSNPELLEEEFRKLVIENNQILAEFKLTSLLQAQNNAMLKHRLHLNNRIGFLMDQMDKLREKSIPTFDPIPNKGQIIQKIKERIDEIPIAMRQELSNRFQAMLNSISDEFKLIEQNIRDIESDDKISVDISKKVTQLKKILPLLKARLVEFPGENTNELQRRFNECLERIFTIELHEINDELKELNVNNIQNIENSLNYLYQLANANYSLNAIFFKNLIKQIQFSFKNLTIAKDEIHIKAIKTTNPDLSLLEGIHKEIWKTIGENITSKTATKKLTILFELEYCLQLYLMFNNSKNERESAQPLLKILQDLNNAVLLQKPDALLESIEKAILLIEFPEFTRDQIKTPSIHFLSTILKKTDLSASFSNTELNQLLPILSASLKKEIISQSKNENPKKEQELSELNEHFVKVESNLHKSEQDDKTKYILDKLEHIKPQKREFFPKLLGELENEINDLKSRGILDDDVVEYLQERINSQKTFIYRKNSSDLIEVPMGYKFISQAYKFVSPILYPYHQKQEYSSSYLNGHLTHLNTISETYKNGNKKDKNYKEALILQKDLDRKFITYNNVTISGVGIMAALLGINTPLLQRLSNEFIEKEFEAVKKLNIPKDELNFISLLLFYDDNHKFSQEGFYRTRNLPVYLTMKKVPSIKDVDFKIHIESNNEMRCIDFTMDGKEIKTQERFIIDKKNEDFSLLYDDKTSYARISKNYLEPLLKDAEILISKFEKLSNSELHDLIVKIDELKINPDELATEKNQVNLNQEKVMPLIKPLFEDFELSSFSTFVSMLPFLTDANFRKRFITWQLTIPNSESNEVKEISQIADRLIHETNPKIYKAYLENKQELEKDKTIIVSKLNKNIKLLEDHKEFNLARIASEKILTPEKFATRYPDRNNFERLKTKSSVVDQLVHLYLMIDINQMHENIHRNSLLSSGEIPILIFDPSNDPLTILSKIKNLCEIIGDHILSEEREIKIELMESFRDLLFRINNQINGKEYTSAEKFLQTWTQQNWVQELMKDSAEFFKAIFVDIDKRPPPLHRAVPAPEALNSPSYKPPLSSTNTSPSSLVFPTPGTPSVRIIDSSSPKPLIDPDLDSRFQDLIAPPPRSDTHFDNLYVSAPITVIQPEINTIDDLKAALIEKFKSNHIVSQKDIEDQLLIQGSINNLIAHIKLNSPLAEAQSLHDIYREMNTLNAENLIGFIDQYIRNNDTNNEEAPEKTLSSSFEMKKNEYKKSEENIKLKPFSNLETGLNLLGATGGAVGGWYAGAVIGFKIGAALGGIATVPLGGLGAIPIGILGSFIGLIIGPILGYAFSNIVNSIANFFGSKLSNPSAVQKDVSKDVSVDTHTNLPPSSHRIIAKRTPQISPTPKPTPTPTSELEKNPAPIVGSTSATSPEPGKTPSSRQGR